MTRSMALSFALLLAATLSGCGAIQPTDAHFDPYTNGSGPALQWMPGDDRSGPQVSKPLPPAPTPPAAR